MEGKTVASAARTASVFAHADVSIVIDLSHTPYDEKLEYVRTLLPGLATLRRHTGCHIVLWWMKLIIFSTGRT